MSMGAADGGLDCSMGNPQPPPPPPQPLLFAFITKYCCCRGEVSIDSSGGDSGCDITDAIDAFRSNTAAGDMGELGRSSVSGGGGGVIGWMLMIPLLVTVAAANENGNMLTGGCGGGGGDARDDEEEGLGAVVAKATRPRMASA